MGWLNSLFELREEGELLIGELAGVPVLLAVTAYQQLSPIFVKRRGTSPFFSADQRLRQAGWSRRGSFSVTPFQTIPLVLVGALETNFLSL